MVDPALAALAEGLATAGRNRYPRWDPTVWDAVVEGPGAHLAASGVKDAVLRSYLEVAVAAVGQGYLFSSTAGLNPCTWLWMRALPQRLPLLPDRVAAYTLAGAWNLSENLESAPGWLREICLVKLQGWPEVEDLEGLLEEVRSAVFDTPEPLSGRAYMGGRFLPGRLHFVTPAVLCVHDRHDPKTARGVWLERPLCSTVCDELPPLEGGDEEVFATASCGERSASSLWTSQFVLLR